MVHRVAFIRQRNYEPASLRASIGRALELAGFDLGSTSEKRVLLKPNMLGAYPPSMGVTTHPAFVAAVGAIFHEAGAVVAVGDSSNGVHGIDPTWEATGIREACRAGGFEEVHFEACGSATRGNYLIARAPLEADLVVNLPKFKTHGLTTLTLAVKNLFGCIAGMQKFAVHRAHIAAPDFAAEIVRIADAVRPALTVIDGIVAMEGDGPSGGTLTELGVIAAGTDMHAVDAACCRLIGFPPEALATLAAAKRLGLWDASSPIDVVGDPMEELRPRHFKLPATSTKDIGDRWYARLALRLVWSQAWAQPAISAARCRRCGLCVEACPVQVISRAGPQDVPTIDYKGCIQCFCCHETCPYKAIDIRQSWPVRVARWFAERQMRRKATDGRDE